MKVDYMQMPWLMWNQKPLSNGIVFDDSSKTVFYIQPRSGSTSDFKSFEAPTGLSLHVIHSYEQDNKVLD